MLKITHKIKALELELELIKKEPGVNWLGKWGRSVRINSVEKKIKELKKKETKK